MKQLIKKYQVPNSGLQRKTTPIDNTKTWLKNFYRTWNIENSRQKAIIENRKSSKQRLNPIYKTFEFFAKNSNNPQAKSIWTMFTDVVTGRDKSFYSQDRRNGSNEIDTYLYGEPYNEEFTGDPSIGPQYTNYIKKNYPNKKIKTYNTHFADTLYIDNSGKPIVQKYIESGKTAGGSMGRFAEAPSYTKTSENDRPYDAGGMLMKFTKDKNGQVYANMSDIYDFLPSDFSYEYGMSEGGYSPAKKLLIKTMNNIGTPFIVRQNNVPVKFIDWVPKYKTKAQEKMGQFLTLFGDMYDLNIPFKMSDKEIEECFNSAKYGTGDEIIEYMRKKGYVPTYN